MIVGQLIGWSIAGETGLGVGGFTTAPLGWLTAVSITAPIGMYVGRLITASTGVYIGGFIGMIIGGLIFIFGAPQQTQIVAKMKALWSRRFRWS